MGLGGGVKYDCGEGVRGLSSCVSRARLTPLVEIHSLGGGRKGGRGELRVCLLLVVLLLRGG